MKLSQRFTNFYLNVLNENHTLEYRLQHQVENVWDMTSHLHINKFFLAGLLDVCKYKNKKLYKYVKTDPYLLSKWNLYILVKGVLIMDVSWCQFRTTPVFTAIVPHKIFGLPSNVSFFVSTNAYFVNGNTQSPWSSR